MRRGGPRTRTICALAVCAATAYAALAACGSDESATIPPPTGADAASDGTISTGEGGVPGPGPSGSIDSNEAARAAVVLGSCVPDDGVHRYLADIYLQRTNDPEEKLVFHDAVHCLATKNTGCAAVKDCLGIEVDIVPDASDCVRECNGTVRTGCDNRLRFREDCARHGEVCETPDGGRAACFTPGLPPCPLGSSGGYTPRCEQNRPTYCTGPYETTGIDCTTEGLVCTSGHCMGTEGNCTADSNGPNVRWDRGIACDGTDKLKACVNGGIATIACASLQAELTCHTIILDGGTPASYCGLAEECIPPSRANQACNGDSIVVCNAGRTDLIDCKSLGFTTCTAGRGCTPSL